MHAHATPEAEIPESLQGVLQRYGGGAALRVGRVRLVVEPLVDNGNSVPVVIHVDSSMTEQDHVTHLALFADKNPQPDVAEFALTPASGIARVATRVRLATTQQLVAVAKLSDGSCWIQPVRVIVTLAACIED